MKTNEIYVKKKKKRNYKKIFLFLTISFFIGFIIALLAGVGIYFKFSRDLPPIESLQNYEPSLITKFYSRNNELITELFIEKRILVPLSKIPQKLKEAIIAVEDARFLKHRGIDYQGIFRAMLKNVEAGEVVQGGSTITQQVAKAMFLTPERSLARKIKEAILAYRMERYFTKEDILNLYLNHIYFGHGAYGVEAAARSYFGKHVEELNLVEMATLSGLPRAPSKYSPYLHPERAKTRCHLALKRMLEEGYITAEEFKTALATPLILKAVEEKEELALYFVEYIRKILEEKYGSTALYRSGLSVYTTLDVDMQRAAQEAVRDGLKALDKRQGYRGPLRHIDLKEASELYEGEASQIEIKVAAEATAKEEKEETLQIDQILEGMVVALEPDFAKIKMGNEEGILNVKDMSWVYGYKDGHENPKKPKKPEEVFTIGDEIEVKILNIDKEKGEITVALEQEPIVEGSLICLDTKTGYILTMVGGYNFRRSQFNRTVQSKRQPGSAFKPFIYATAISKGFTPASIIIDSPIIYENLEEEAKIEKWKPENYEEKFHGPTRLRTALVHSRNVPTIKLLREVGMENVSEMAYRLGVSDTLTEDLSLALGSSGVTLLELTSAYGVFANQGILTEPISIRYIKDRHGNIIDSNEPQPKRVLDEDVSYIMADLLQGVVKEGTGWRVRALGRPVAGKTGTTNNFIDAWFLGFTPNLATGVWVGFDQEQPLGQSETGSRAASPIWLQFMKEALAGKPAQSFPVPENIVFTKIDEASGLLAVPETENILFECFIEGTEPTKYSEVNVPKSEDFFRIDAEN